ncbi:UbiA family prenyltransferase [Marinimicrobium alkaliphilum]|uniref:UbiA family prenyltransferase n=1 Tax=Marinimicrobium alkaliphilum TaxID=2202654 RepID=UPI0013004F76|nr:UbiA family prenyltransferase [Marinimicrobium alkaliphilum]
MPRLKTLLTLCRVSNLPTVWMNILCAAALAGALIDHPGGLALVLIAVSAFYAAGMSFNDYCDRHWDAERQPFRPIPSGRIGARTALRITLGLFALGFVCLYLAPHPRAPLAGAALVGVILLYDWLHKRHWATVGLMALTRLGVYLVAAVALTGEIPALVWLVGALQGLYTLAVTAVARWENHRIRPYPFPVIPWMIAAMGLLDGLVLAIALHPAWLLAGVAVTLLTRLSQRYVRGD